MGRIKSEEYFHRQPDNFNCAQSILKGFQREFRISDETVEKFRAFGGGRAEDGLCGALYAANYLMEKIGKKSVNESFIRKVNHEKCKEIKAHKYCSCEECVRIADGLIELEIFFLNN